MKTTMQWNAAVLIFGMMALANTAHAQKPGERAPSGKGTTTAVQAAAKVAATGTPTTTGLTGAPPPPAPLVKPMATVAAAATTRPGAMPPVNSKVSH